MSVRKAEKETSLRGGGGGSRMHEVSVGLHHKFQSNA